MTTTELIEILQQIEHTFTGEPREITFFVDDDKEPYTEISFTSFGCTGDEANLHLR